MATQPAQAWLTSKTNPATTTKIGIGVTLGTEVENPKGISKLTGKLTIKDYVNLKEIDLSENELEEIIFINCPKLEHINVSSNKDSSNRPVLEVLDIEKLSVDTATNKPITNALKVLECGANKIIKVDFTYCQKLLNFSCPNNSALDRIENIDRVEGIERINMHKSGPVKVMHQVKENTFRAVVNEVKEIFGVEHVGDLPTEDIPDSTSPTGVRTVIKKDALKNQLMDKVVDVKNPQLKTDKENAEKERDEAKKDLSSLLTEIVSGAGLGLTGNITKDKITTKIKEIEQQVTQVVNGLLTEINNLGLKLSLSDITKEKVFEKIRELINKQPATSSCTHTDYDAIKAERDRLKNENKENDQSVAKEILVKNVENRFSGWGIADSKYKEELKNASANEVEELRNKLIDKRFSELGKEKKTALALNITLGVLTIGSLLVLGWLLMREANPSKVEPEQDKKEKK